MQTLVWDKTLSWNEWFRDDVLLPRLKRAGYGVVGLTVGGGDCGRAKALEGVESVVRMIEQHPAEYRLVRDIADVEMAQRDGQLALELTFQGIDPLEGRLAAVEEFHRLGVRQMGIVWNSDNEVGGSATSAVDTGLTSFGRQLISEMNRAGVIVDGSHAGYRTTMEAMALCDAPFVFSHGNVDAIERSYKNLKDDQIRECARTGGVIGVGGFGTYLDDVQVPPQAIFRQIDYICDLVGPQHVGLGLDFLRDPEPLWQKVRANPQLWPGVRESRFFPPEEVQEVSRLMRDAGYADADVAGILGGNWKRVCDAVWRKREAPDHASG